MPPRISERWQFVPLVREDYFVGGDSRLMWSSLPPSGFPPNKPPPSSETIPVAAAASKAD